jgi:hypothetical protein
MQEGQQPTAEKPVAAFVLSLLAGLWMLATGTMMSGRRVGNVRMDVGPRDDAGLGSHVVGPWFGLIAGLSS